MNQTPIIPIDVEYKQKDWARCKGNALSDKDSAHDEEFTRNLCNSNGYAKAGREGTLGRERRCSLGEMIEVRNMVMVTVAQRGCRQQPGADRPGIISIISFFA